MCESAFHVCNLNGESTECGPERTSCRGRLTDPFLVGLGQKTPGPNQKSETSQLPSEGATVVYIIAYKLLLLTRTLTRSSIAPNLSLGETPRLRCYIFVFALVYPQNLIWQSQKGSCEIPTGLGKI